MVLETDSSNGWQFGTAAGYDRATHFHRSSSSSLLTGKMIKRAVNLGILQQLHPNRMILPMSLYADDVMLFCHPVPSDVAAVKEKLLLFGQVSGLRVNFVKISATLLYCDPEEAEPVVLHLGR